MSNLTRDIPVIEGPLIEGPIIRRTGPVGGPVKSDLTNGN